MKRYKYILFTLVVTIFGCQSEIDVNDMGDNTNENFVPMSFYAGIEIPQDSSLTKTILDGTSSDALRNLLWEYQDEVYVTNGSQSSKFTNVSQGTSAMALLEGNLGEGADYFAAYPYIRPAAGRFASSIPNAMGRRSRGSNCFTIARYSRTQATTIITY